MQNCRYWSDNNQHVIAEKSFYPKKVTVWCALWSGGIIGPYFFENECGNVVTVNEERYRSMIKDYFWHQLDALDLKDMWFQQDCATCHTSTVTIFLLRERFHDRVISRNGDAQWPQRSRDITHLDFFLWSYVKSVVYWNEPKTINDLKGNINCTVSDITADSCESGSKLVFQNLLYKKVQRRPFKRHYF